VLGLFDAFHILFLSLQTSLARLQADVTNWQNWTNSNSSNNNSRQNSAKKSAGSAMKKKQSAAVADASPVEEDVVQDLTLSISNTQNSAGKATVAVLLLSKELSCPPPLIDFYVRFIFFCS